MVRLAASDFRIGRCDADHSITVQGRILNGLTLWTPQDQSQRLLWPTEVQFSQDYFESLTQHAVPLNETAVSRLAHTAMGLDAYAWLAQRLHRIAPGQKALVSWPALAQQFGSGYAEVRGFRRVLCGDTGVTFIPHTGSFTGGSSSPIDYWDNLRRFGGLDLR
jgi:hypothetical protein